MGFAVSAVGNWNGDATGLHDVLIGGTYPWDGDVNTHAGMAALFLDPTATGCDETPNLRINGVVGANGQGEAFGYDVAFIGDIDGDGKDDFAVGAPRAPYGTMDWTEKGRVYIFLSCHFSLATGTIAASSASLIIEGPGADDRFGNSIAEVGDFDGNGVDDFQWNSSIDSIPDLVVGAPGGLDSAQSYSGRVYVISGADIRCKAGIGAANCGGPTESCPTPTSNVKVLGTDIIPLATWSGAGTDPLEKRDRFGFSVALAGDVGEDALGDPDIVVGAPQFLDLPGAYPGGMFGPGYVRVLTGSGASDYVPFTGGGTDDETWGCFGLSVSGQVDLDATPDGKPDIIIGEPLFDDSGPGGTGLKECGKVYVYSVASSTLITSSIGRGREIFYGWTVQGLGRFNEPTDTRDYYAVCASRFGTNAAQGACNPPQCAGGTSNPGDALCGRLYVLGGNDGFPCWTVTGENFRDSCGWAISRIGDLGVGSTRPELLFTSPRWAVGHATLPEVGKAYIRHR
jgi:hypothetical protein